MRESKEDYLITMYTLHEKGEIKSVDIANLLNVSKPSVSEMIRKLDKEHLIEAKPYSKIKFTRKGLDQAKRIMHNHRVIEVFLRKVLKYDIDKVHEEAHRLEHAFSGESIKRLDKLVNNPKRSPFGKRIPH